VKTHRFLFALLSLTVVPLSAAAQSPEEAEGPRKNRLPNPLDLVSSNIKDIEKTGYFTIVNAEYRRTELGNDEAMVWTLQTTKPITCRHAGWLLRRFRDVRFYYTERRSVQEIHNTLMYYSHAITDGATNGDILSLDDRFIIWVPLTADDIRLLRVRRVDKAVFREFKG